MSFPAIGPKILIIIDNYASYNAETFEIRYLANKENKLHKFKFSI